MSRFTDQFVISAALPTSANGSTGPVDVRKYQSFSIQATFNQAGPATGAGNLLLQGSNDQTTPPTNFTTLAGTTTAYTGATTTLVFDPIVTNLRWIRVSAAGTSGAGGLVALEFNGVWES